MHNSQASQETIQLSQEHSEAFNQLKRIISLVDTILNAKNQDAQVDSDKILDDISNTFEEMNLSMSLLPNDEKLNFLTRLRQYKNNSPAFVETELDESIENMQRIIFEAEKSSQTSLSTNSSRFPFASSSEEDLTQPAFGTQPALS